jgi:GT2 family glycosyltransferase
MVGLMEARPRVHVVAPTFRESALIPSFIEAWSGVTGADLRLWVVNANPGDETSRILSLCQGTLPVREVAAGPELYWSGLTELGLREIAANAGEGDYFLITNVDVRPRPGNLSAIFAAFPQPDRTQIAIPVVGDSGRIVSAGVQVRSWVLSLNRHLGEGLPPAALAEMGVLEATFLPTRFLLVPTAALRMELYPDVDRLPHYCADYEYTNRLRLAGFKPLVFAGTHAELSEKNTGFDTFLMPTRFRERLARIGDIKCPYNLRYRYRFVKLTYPAWAFVPGLITHFAKIFLEIGLGGRRLRHLRRS